MIRSGLENLIQVDVYAAPCSTVQSTVRLVFAAAAALAISITAADASVREISASSYGFSDSAWTANGFEGPRRPLVPGWAPECFVNCGPASGSYVVQRSDLLTSNTADVSAKKTADATGHPMGVGGMVVIERLESDGPGSLLNWVVVSERVLDENGAHSWSLLSGPAADAPWRPSDLYRFEGSSFSFDLAAEPPTTPEASTWVMTLIGLAVVIFARYRSSRRGRFSTRASQGALV